LEKFRLTIFGLTEEGVGKLSNLRHREADGIPCGAVKCVEMGKNTRGEGDLLAML
jgi:hypothetical protein